MKPREKFERLRDDCEAQARDAERRMFDPELSQAARSAAADEAKSLWQMSRLWADKVAHDADVRPLRFTAKNTGTQDKTERRKELVRRLLDGQPSGTRKARANAIWLQAEARNEFEEYEKLLNFLAREKL